MKLSPMKLSPMKLRQMKPSQKHAVNECCQTSTSLSSGPWIGAESDEAASDEAASDEAASDEAESEACCEQVLPNKYISELGGMVCDSD